MYKSMLPVIDFDVIVFVMLFILLFFYKKKFDLKLKVNKMYFNCIIIVQFLIFLEVLDKVILLSNNPVLVPLSKITNMLGFMLSPVVPYIYNKYIFKIFNMDVNMFIPKILLAINGVISVLSCKYGFIFSITETNIYKRGPLFFIPMTVTIICFSLAIISIIKNKEKVENNYKVLIRLQVIPIIAAVIQVFFVELLLIWGSVGVILIVRYLFLQEDLLKYDPLTGLLNRRAFELYFCNKFTNKNKPFILVYFDLNDFKYINDTFGHNEGDIALINVSKLLVKCFKGVGQVARIGGDEFIAVMDSCSEEEFNNIKQAIRLELDKLNDDDNAKYILDLSLGYKIFCTNKLKLSDYIIEIDELMYEDKRKNKMLKEKNSK